MSTCNKLSSKVANLLGKAYPQIQWNPPYGNPWKVAIYDIADRLIACSPMYLRLFVHDQNHWNVETFIFCNAGSFSSPNSTWTVQNLPNNVDTRPQSKIVHRLQ